MKEIKDLVKKHNGSCRSDNYKRALDSILRRYAQEDQLGSRNKLSKVMKHKGLCLTNGKLYGGDLEEVLRENKNLRMPLKKVKKEYTHLKYCLVKLFGK